METTPKILDPERRTNIATAKSFATGLGLNLKLGMETDVENSPKADELIVAIRSKLDEFEKAKQVCQDEIDVLANQLFNR